jgi:chemotaxis protein methyltransferase CheR
MTDLIIKMAEEIFGINVHPSDVERLRVHITEKYGEVNLQDIKKIFNSGEAAGFLTVNETYFFREPLHFDFLASLLPAFEDSSVLICSAATSTGCEAYSIAMFLEWYNRGRAKPLRYHIDAFDIDQEALNKAIKGVYGERCLREDGNKFRHIAERWLSRCERGYQVDGALRGNIRFFTHNLMEAFSPQAYHLVFFRNAFIYFSPRARPIVLSNLSGALKKDGILILGVSETAQTRHETLENKSKGDVFYFQKATDLSK